MLFSFALTTCTDAASVRAADRDDGALARTQLRDPGVNMPVGARCTDRIGAGCGDMVTAAMGAYIVWEARNLGLPKWKLARMGLNLVFDTAIGAIPVVGDAADFVFRSNTRNLRIIRRHLDKHHPQTRVIEG